MARGFGKDPREDFSIDRLRYYNKSETPPVAPAKGSYEMYIKNGLICTLDSDGVESCLVSGATGSSAYAEENAETSTTSTTYVEKLSLTTQSLPQGDYRISWNYEAKNPNGNAKTMEVRVQIDNSLTVTEEIVQDTKNQWTLRSGFIQRINLAGVHTIDIDYREVNAEASIRNARIELNRVG